MTGALNYQPLADLASKVEGVLVVIGYMLLL
jgi:hypothetical protein